MSTNANMALNVLLNRKQSSHLIKLMILSLKGGRYKYNQQNKHKEYYNLLIHIF